MKWSKSYLFTLKEAPADAEIPSHILLVRGGYIRKLAPGIFTYGPLLLRAIRKFEQIVREELDSRNCVELLMPMVQPREIWDETSRWDQMGDGLQKMKNRSGHDFCLGATHEEAITDYVRKDVKSYRDLGFTLYQIQTKFRDEIRPRFGLMRGREFVMKDAYSFDISSENAMQSYSRLREAYVAIFSRLGISFRVVNADSGDIGGNLSQEFHVLAESGEDQLLVGEQGSFAANVEVCPAIDGEGETSLGASLLPVEEFATPGVKTIVDLAGFLNVSEKSLVKTLFFSASDDPKVSKPIAVLLRGSDEVNVVKLKKILGMSNPPLLLTDEEVKAVTGARPGSCGPVGLKIPVYADLPLKIMTNIVVGANRDGFHLRNVNLGRDFTVHQFTDLRQARGGDRNPEGPGLLKSVRGIEVGHIFYLGTKYSQSMGARFLNVEGQLQPIEMGCYGIGITRTIQAAVEQCHDKDGIVWPLSIAPYLVHICLLDPQDIEASSLSEKIYKELNSEGVDVFVDDRDERPGVKFKDADLLGFPVRVNIGSRGLSLGQIEVIDRKTKEVLRISPEVATGEIQQLIRKLRECGA